jgi:glutamyl-Q tRNA(Asp) synthetase
MTEGHTRDLTLEGAASSVPSQYRGRFAPSPSGPLHFGSLITALASFLDARSRQGKWLVRIDDIDPPREQPGAADSILRCLEAHHLCWDETVFYQRHQTDVYENCLRELQKNDWIYHCNCSRQDLQITPGIYQGRCRDRQSEIQSPYALRLKLYDLPNHVSSEIIEFNDWIQGRQTQNLRTEAGDQIVKRRDGFYAYQLAVVVDDIAQKISHIVRGRDLLDVTARQIFFFKLLGSKPPAYAHLPLALMPNGQKLSKQNLAPAVDNQQPHLNIWQALHFLDQNPPLELKNSSVDEVLNWAVQNWRMERVGREDRIAFMKEALLQKR